MNTFTIGEKTYLLSPNVNTSQRLFLRAEGKDELAPKTKRWDDIAGGILSVLAFSNGIAIVIYRASLINLAFVVLTTLLVALIAPKKTSPCYAYQRRVVRGVLTSDAVVVLPKDLLKQLRESSCFTPSLQRFFDKNAIDIDTFEALRKLANDFANGRIDEDEIAKSISGIVHYIKRQRDSIKEVPNTPYGSLE